MNDLIVSVNEKHCGFEFEYDEEGVYERSGHYNFARKGIPIAFFFTGFHRDYHEASDDPAKIDFDKLARVARLVYLTAWELAARYSYLSLNGPGVQGGRLNDVTLGINWYLNTYLKFQLNYIRAMLANPVHGSSDTNIVALRAQVDF